MQLTQLVKQYHEFSLWRELNIISNLLLVFNSNYRHLGHTSYACHILNYILHII